MHFSEILANPYTFDAEKVGFLNELVDTYPYCQPARMMHAKALMEMDKQRAEAEVKKAMAAAPNRRLFRDYLSDRLEKRQTPENPREESRPSETETEAVSTIEKKRRQLKIIDQFIEQQPRITPARRSVPEGELARESVEEHPDLVSETLAEVLLRQGKKERAIMIYKKLCLMFPEKSSYFAKKLEQIQKEEH